MEISYNFIVYPGNHPEVIKESLIRRRNMKEMQLSITKDQAFLQAHVIWRPVGYSKKSLNILHEIIKTRSNPIVVFE